MSIKSESVSFLFLGLSLLLIQSCGTENRTQKRAWYYEHEFSENDTLYAKIENLAILNITSSDDPEESENHNVRYSYENGKYVFCIDPHEKYIKSLTLLDENDRNIFDLGREQGCKEIDLDAGRYSLQITHDASKVPERGTVAFIHHPHEKRVNDTMKGVSERGLHDTPGSPYYAFRVTLGTYEGYYLGTKKVKEGNTGETDDFLGLLSPSDRTSFLEMRHLFKWNEKEGKSVLEGYNWTSNLMKPDCDIMQNLCVPSQSDANDANIIYGSGNIAPVDLYRVGDAGQTFSLWNETMPYIMEESSLYTAENGLLYRTVTAKYSVPTTMFRKIPNVRLYRDGSQYTLQDDEVALSAECGFAGPTYVISGEIQDASIVSLPQIKAIGLGGNYATLSLFEEKNFSTLSRTFGMNDDCLKTPIDSGKIGSMKVFDAKKVFLSSHQCLYCNLADANLSHLNLDNVLLRYANLTKTLFNNSIMQKADMRYAKLYGANLNYTDLNGSTMCGAFLNGNELSKYEAATLTGAYLKNVNLADAKLDGANFDNANFHSSTTGGCIPADCGYSRKCASAANSTLDSATFTNAYLTGVDFSNSNIVVSDFTNAVLTGAKFKNATITGDRNKGATTKFIGAFLQGVDFSDAKVTSTDFTNAYVDLKGDNAMLFLLSSSHTGFAGWPYKNKKVCTMYAYTSATTLPAVDGSSNCPDGSIGPCSDWTDPAIDMNESIQKASYVTDSNPVCDDPNFNW